MNSPAARYPVAGSSSDDVNVSSSSTVPAIDEQAFIRASKALSLALDQAAAGRTHADIAVARQRLRELAVRLRDAGYWRTDKHGLRATVSLLWQADRYVSEMALKQARDEQP